MSKIIFLVQQISQPRCIKRIEDVSSSCIPFEVYGFNNGLYEGNLKDLNFKINEIRYINKSSKKKVKIFKYYQLVKHVLKNSNKQDIIYCFGFELGAICSILNHNRKIVYEEADVSASRFGNTILKTFLLNLDKWIIHRASLVIFTSKGFVEYLFKRSNPYKNKIIFIENKLHPSFSEIERPSITLCNSNSITFGFIGLIRYPNTILRFARVVGKHFPQHQFYFYGDIEGNIIDKNEWGEFQNIKFFGRFRNPQDLIDIYSQIDINVSCYDTQSENVRIAEPNKLYESIYFMKPIVVSKDTFLSKRVQEFESGYSINATEDSYIINFIQGLSSEKINTTIKKISNIPSNVLINNKEELIRRLYKLLYDL